MEKSWGIENCQKVEHFAKFEQRDAKPGNGPGKVLEICFAKSGNPVHHIIFYCGFLVYNLKFIVHYNPALKSVYKTKGS